MDPDLEDIAIDVRKMCDELEEACRIMTEQASDKIGGEIFHNQHVKINAKTHDSIVIIKGATYRVTSMYEHFKEIHGE